MPPGLEEGDLGLQLSALTRRPGITGLDPRLDTSMLLNYVPGKLGILPDQLLVQIPVFALTETLSPEGGR